MRRGGCSDVGRGVGVGEEVGALVDARRGAGDEGQPVGPDARSPDPPASAPMAGRAEPSVSRRRRPAGPGASPVSRVASDRRGPGTRRSGWCPRSCGRGGAGPARSRRAGSSGRCDAAATADGRSGPARRGCSGGRPGPWRRPPGGIDRDDEAKAGPRGGGSARLELGDVLDQAGLASGGLVLVDDALGGGLVDALDRQAGQLVDVLVALLGGGGRRALVRVFSSERTALLRTRRFSFCLLRLIWLLMFATGCPGISGAEGAGARRGRSQRPVDTSGSRPRDHNSAPIGSRRAGPDRGPAATLASARPPVQTRKPASPRVRPQPASQPRRSSPTSTTARSTLADRMLEICGAVDPRDMRAQYLDSMDLERERGITIKLQTVRLDYRDHVLNLIDTPGPRRLRLRGVPVAGRLRGRDPARRRGPGHRGPDAGQLLPRPRERPRDRRRASTRSTCRPPTPTATPQEIENVLGIPADEILRISAKTGEGVPELLDAVVERIPAPDGRPRRAAAGADLRLALRPVPRRGQLGPGDERHAAHRRPAAVHAGRGHPRRRRGRRPPTRPRRPVAELGPARSATSSPASRTSARPARVRPSPTRPSRRPPLEGYRDPKPMVFCGLYPVDGDDFADLREALEKLRLNDSSFTYEPETSGRARLRVPLRVPRPAAHGDHPRAARARVRPEPHRHRPVGRVPGAHDRRRRASIVDNPSEMPAAGEIEHIEEPYLTVTILTPTDYTGTLMELCQTRRGEMQKLEYLSPERVELSTGCRWPRSSSTSSTR